MGRRTHSPRGNLPGRRTYQEGFGAFHPVAQPKDGKPDPVREFFIELGRRWLDIMPQREPADRDLTGLPEDRFKLYDDPRKMRVEVLERRLSAQQARRHRLRWNLNDVGRLRGQIGNALSRLILDDPDDFQLTLVSSMPVGDADRAGSKFGLVPNAKDSVARFLTDEHDIVVDGLRGVFAGFRYPYAQYLPHLTVGRIYRGASPQTVESAAGMLQDLIAEKPLTVPLEDIAFFAHQEL